MALNLARMYGCGLVRKCHDRILYTNSFDSSRICVGHEVLGGQAPQASVLRRDHNVEGAHRARDASVLLEPPQLRADRVVVASDRLDGVGGREVMPPTRCQGVDVLLGPHGLQFSAKTIHGVGFIKNRHRDCAALRFQSNLTPRVRLVKNRISQSPARPPPPLPVGSPRAPSGSVPKMAQGVGADVECAS